MRGRHRTVSARPARIVGPWVVGVLVVAALAGAAPAVPALPTSVPAGALAPQGRAPDWSVGDCYAVVDVPAITVDLTTKVPCRRDHGVQVIGGADLPPALASLDRDGLLSTTGATRTALDDLVDATCAPATVAANLYPRKIARSLARLFDEYDVTGPQDWMIPAAGELHAMLPDGASFDAGAKAVLCTFVPDPAFSGSTAGDVRRIASGDPLVDLRLCYDRAATGTELTTCGEPHDLQALVWMFLPVDGLPVDVAEWPDAAWTRFDRVCGEFGDAIVGAVRDDLAYRVNTIGEMPLSDGKRFLYCEAYPADEDRRLPGGVSISGIGKQPIRFARG